MVSKSTAQSIVTRGKGTYSRASNLELGDAVLALALLDLHRLGVGALGEREELLDVLDFLGL
jgi:hypothetical protein